MSGLRPRRKVSAVVVLLLAGVAGWLWLAGRGPDRAGESDLRYLERELVRLGSVAAVQTWLLEHPEGPVRALILADITEWPACFRALRALRALEAQNGGVCLRLPRGLSLSVYPHGRRPSREEYRPVSRPLRLVAFGEDVYITQVDH